MRNNILFTLMFSLIMTACNNAGEQQHPENPDLLPTSLVKNPRSAEGTDTAALGAMPSMDFRDTVYDFGTINDGEVVTHDFTFTNNGESPLVISNSTAACGCTVAEFPREPIGPGKTGNIKVQFNSAGKPGHQEKSVTLTTNSDRGRHVLFLKGAVREKK
jgi:hypothetical protein